jgi:hypothetical protein
MCLDPLIKGQLETTELNGMNQWQIFDGKTVTCCDNHFSGKEMVAYAVEHSWGTISTLQHDCFPKGVPTKYFHKEWTNSGGPHPKASWFLQPIIVVKKECCGNGTAK